MRAAFSAAAAWQVEREADGVPCCRARSLQFVVPSADSWSVTTTDGDGRVDPGVGAVGVDAALSSPERVDVAPLTADEPVKVLRDELVTADDFDIVIRIVTHEFVCWPLPSFDFNRKGRNTLQSTKDSMGGLLSPVRSGPRRGDAQSRKQT